MKKGSAVKSCTDWVDTVIVEKATKWNVVYLIKQRVFFFKKGQKMKAKSGFTLVEILIVVVILGILAAIVIPQFTEASTEAKTSSLCTDLQTMRSQIELYKIQHNDLLPAASGDTALDFQARMCAQTNIAGDAGSDYGPYLQKIPTNQFVDSNLVEIDGTVGGGVATAGPGWNFNTTTGAFHADTTVHADL